MNDQPRTATASSSPVFAPHSLRPTYANVLLAASGGFGELVLDFGFDAHRHEGDSAEPVVPVQRLVLPRRTARQLLRTLQDLAPLLERGKDPPPGGAGKRPAAPDTPPAP